MIARWEDRIYRHLRVVRSLRFVRVVLRILGFALAQVWPYYAGSFVLCCCFGRACLRPSHLSTTRDQMSIQDELELNSLKAWAGLCVRSSMR